MNPATGGASQRRALAQMRRDSHGALAVFHTYSAYSRGIEVVNGAYQFLDLVPKGRDEASLSFKMSWLRLHDEYGT